MNKKEENGICICGSPERLGCAIYQLLTKRDIVEEVIRYDGKR